MRKILLFILITLCLEACTSGHNDYSDFKNIEQYGWVYGDTLNFKFDADNIVDGSLKLALRHNNSYEYSNLWLEVSHKIDSVTVDCDTINIELADIYGRWKGNGIGASYQTDVIVNSHFAINGIDSVQVRHIMRCDTLEGIVQVGLIFKANEDE